MPTRNIVLFLRFFAASFVTALLVAALAQVDGIRVLGLTAMSFAACGFALQFDELRREDPHALAVLRDRVLQPLHRTRDGLVRLASRLMAHLRLHAAP
jgi:hypothetical protein